jgi:hypothetical protein
MQTRGVETLVSQVLEAVEQGSAVESLTLASGRRYELSAGAAADTLTVRSATGRVLLRVAVSDAGPLLSFESAEITLSARNRLAVCAPELKLASAALTIDAGDLDERVAGDHVTAVGGDRHARIGGEERLEAAALALQANDAGLSLRAMKKIALDGALIGLNDDPCPTPFGWSALAERSDA